MNKRDIRTGKDPVSCDVCGRTLLPGESAETFLTAGARRQVCELCAARAAHQGWVRETAALDLGEVRPLPEQRRRFLERLRGSRERGQEESGEVAGATERSGPQPPPAEPRDVHAIPMSGEMKASQALDYFNGSEHRRTVAGVRRSLGTPAVAVRNGSDRPNVVTIVISWELCWYRYEVDLADGSGGVELVSQGYELSELGADDQAANATAEEDGSLGLAAPRA